MAKTAASPSRQTQKVPHFVEVSPSFTRLTPRFFYLVRLALVLLIALWEPPC